jgi:hypothetical protein
MWRRWQGLVLIIVLCGLAAAKNPNLEDLKTKADAAHGGEQAKLCLEYAHGELEYANDLFTKGDVEQAQSAVNSVMEYARKGAGAAASSGKRLKQTEIELRKLQKRMRDIGDSLSLDDRPPVMAYVKEIEQLRDRLLGAMFGAKDKS